MATYPLDSDRVPPAPGFHALWVLARSARDLSGRRRRPKSITLSPVKGQPKPLARDDIPLIVATRNSMRLLKTFLIHYRSLGVTRFLVVDDRSTDETAAFLEGEADVDLFASNVRYRESKRSRFWRNMLVDLYGSGRWYLNVDSDEFLIYRRSEKIGLAEVIQSLRRRGILHMPAPMLDMYPRGRVSEANYAGDVMPWEVAPLFDRAGYALSRSKRNWELSGGVRERALHTRVHLIKYPLMYWGRETNLFRSIHAPCPYWRNFNPPLGALLHFKFFSGFDEDFRVAQRQAQHAQNGEYYAQMLENIGDPHALVLEDEVSEAYTSSDGLYRLGFFQDWRGAT